MGGGQHGVCCHSPGAAMAAQGASALRSRHLPLTHPTLWSLLGSNVGSQFQANSLVPHQEVGVGMHSNVLFPVF